MPAAVCKLDAGLPFGAALSLIQAHIFADADSLDIL